MKRPTILAIEGNIGAGKTTLFDHLKKIIYNPKIVFMREPVDIWQSICDVSGNSILSKFYGDSDKYAFPFQIMAFSTRLALLRKTIEEHPDCELIICERSLEADKNIFAKMLFMEGRIEDVNYQIYHHLYNTSAIEYKVDAIVYVDADPDICFRRIHVRNRDGEDGIQLDYLKRCRNYYHDWLIYGSYSGGKTNCHYYDGEKEDDNGVLNECGKGKNSICLENNEENKYIERHNELNETIFKKMVVEKEYIPEVLRINANYDAKYENGDIGELWLKKCLEFIEKITCG